MANQEDVFARRRENLRALIRQHQGASALAKVLGYTSPSYLSQMTGPHPSRQMTEKVSRDIERKLLLPAGWLDNPPETFTTKQGGADEDRIQQLVLLVGELLRDTDTTVCPEQFAALVALSYERGTLDETYVRRLIYLINPATRKKP